MVARVIAMDRICTGEHGVGLSTINLRRDELDETVDVMRSINTVLNPKGLINPRKVFLPTSPEPRS